MKDPCDFCCCMTKLSNRKWFGFRYDFHRKTDHCNNIYMFTYKLVISQYMRNTLVFPRSCGINLVRFDTVTWPPMPMMVNYTFYNVRFVEMLRCESLIWIILGNLNGFSNWIGLDNNQILRWLNLESFIIHASFAITIPRYTIRSPSYMAIYDFKISMAILMIISHLESNQDFPLDTHYSTSDMLRFLKVTLCTRRDVCVRLVLFSKLLHKITRCQWSNHRVNRAVSKHTDNKGAHSYIPLWINCRTSHRYHAHSYWRIFNIGVPLLILAFNVVRPGSE